MPHRMTEEEVQAARRDLQACIDGSVSGLAEAAYRAAVNLDNGRIQRAPRLVVAPLSAGDVAETLRYCADRDIRVTTKSGGHGAAGYCLNSDGVVIDLTNLSSIGLDDSDRTLTVGMGAQWAQVYSHLAERNSQSLAVGGGCGTVGLGGFLLGGGFSFLSRSYGLGCDSIRSVEFVSACGDIYRLDGQAKEPHERDLFWALRGGGGGNFGIVTSAELALHRTPKLMVGTLAFSLDQTAEVLEFYNGWVETLPNAMAIYGMLRRFSDPKTGGAPVLGLHLTPIYNGPLSDGLALLQPLLAMAPSSVEISTMSFPQWEALVGNGTLVNGRSAYIRSAILPPKGLTRKVVEVLTRGLRQAPSDDSFVVWTHAGGAIRDATQESSCFAHRDGEFVLELKSIWQSIRPEETQLNVEWALDFFDELDAHAQGSYLNYIDPLLKNWQERYYRSSYDRLLQVKDHWDPTGQFNFQQSIGSTYRPNTARPVDLGAINRT